MKQQFVRFAIKLRQWKNRLVKPSAYLPQTPKNLKNSIYILSIAFIGCQTVEKPKVNWSNLQMGKWEASAEVVENRTGKSQSLDLMFRAIKNKGVRMDVSAMLGTPVASVVVEDSQIKGLLVRQKKYYEGAANAEVMKQALGIGFDPLLINAVLFDSVEKLSGWNCKSEKVSKRCIGPREDIIVAIDNSNGIKREAEIDTAEIKLTIKFNKFVENFPEENIFFIKKPKSFNTVTL